MNTVLQNAAWWLGVWGSALPWFINLELLGLAAVPLVFGVATRLHDRGWALSKALGLVLATYLAWLLAHGPMEFGYRAVAAGAGVVACVSALSAILSWRDLGAFLRGRWRVVLATEALFAAAFFTMVTYRALVPQITYVIGDSGAEKFTDFAVMNGLLTSVHFPPHDVWVAGAPLNYYYFGHLLWASLTRLSGVLPEVGFNLGLASIFALVCAQGFSLGFNLTGRRAWGLLAMFLIAVAGNLDGFLQLVSSLLSGGRGSWHQVYDFWRPSRAIENTITEFPAFSFVLGDLHAHLSSLVILLAGMLLILQMTRSSRGEPSLLAYELRHPAELVLAALIAGALYAANTWDVISFTVLLAVLLWAARPIAPGLARGERAGWRLLQGAEAAFLAALVAVLGIAVFFNFQFRVFQSPIPAGWPAGAERTLTNFVSPLRVVNSLNRSSWLEFLSHWLLLMAVPAALALHLAWRAGCDRTGRTVARSVPGEQFWGIAALAAAAAATLFALLSGWVAALGTVAVVVLWLSLVLGTQPPALRTVLGLLLTFCGAAVFCELLAFADVFQGASERINTVFKFYYALWPVAVMAFLMAARRWVRWAPPTRRWRRGAWLLVPVVLAGMAYPVAAPLARIASSPRLPEPPETPAGALDGMRYLMYLHPGDYAAIRFFRTRTAPDARILEAPGTQYQYYGRISTNSGRPALGGWLVHATSWRGARFEAIRDARMAAAKRIYETRDARLAFTLLKDEEIRYVVVGDAERGLYPTIDEEKFALFAKKVFSFDGTAVYEVDPNTDPATLPVPPVAASPPASRSVIDIPDFLAAVTTVTASTAMTTVPAAKRPEAEDGPTTVVVTAATDELTTSPETTGTASR